MSMTDPIADLLTRIRNGQSARKAEVSMASSKVKAAIVRVLKDEGYVADFRLDSDGGKPIEPRGKRLEPAKKGRSKHPQGQRGRPANIRHQGRGRRK